MKSYSAEEDEAMKVSKETPVTMPLALLITLAGAIVVGAAAWNSTRADIAEDKREIERHTVQLKEITAEVRTTREILIRIDENVKALKADKLDKPR